MKFTNPGATATLIVENQGRILYVERKHEPYRGMLALPGGFLEYRKESLEEAGARELMEEVGLLARAEDLELLMVNSRVDRDPRDHVIDHLFIVKKYSGAVTVGDDAERAFWILLGEEGRLAFDHNKAIKKYIEWRRR